MSPSAASKLSHPGLRIPGLASLVLAACTNTTLPLPSMRMTLEPYLVPCRTEASMACMAYKDMDNDQAGVLYGEIEGFHFEWGYRQILQVDRRRIVHPPADAPDIEYILVKTLEKTSSPDWSFRAVLQASGLRLDGDTLSVPGYPRSILVDAPEDREKLKGTDAPFLEMRVRPGPGDSDSGPLRGDSVRFLP